MSEGNIYPSVGIECGVADVNGKPQEVIGIMYPTPTSEIDDIYDTRFIPLPAAKSLLIDLRDAIEACEKHAMGELPDDPTDKDSG